MEPTPENTATIVLAPTIAKGSAWLMKNRPADSTAVVVSQRNWSATLNGRPIHPHAEVIVLPTRVGGSWHTQCLALIATCKAKGSR